MKKKLTKTAWEALSEELQGLYKKAEGSDNYLLEIEDDDDSGAELKKAKDREKKRADKAEADKVALENRIAELEEAASATNDGALDKAGVEALKKKHDAEIAKLKTEVAEKDGHLQEHLVLSTARAMAAEISTVPDLLEDKIAKRLKLVYDDGKPVVKVIGEDGEVTDKKIEDLKASFVADEKFASIIVGSKASGGGAAGGSKGGGASKKKLSEMSATEEAEFANKNPEVYDRMLSEQGS